MATKKTGKVGRPKREQARVTISNFKGSPKFAEYSTRGADFLRMPMALVIEHAIIEYFKARGFDEEAPKR